MQALLTLGDYTYHSTNQEKGKLVAVDDIIPVLIDTQKIDLRNENTEQNIHQVDLDLKKKQEDKQEIIKMSTKIKRRQTQTKKYIDEPGWKFHENPTLQWDANT